MPFAESPRVLDQTREHVIKPGVVGFDFNKFGQFQLSVSKKKKKGYLILAVLRGTKKNSTKKKKFPKQK